MGARKLPQNWVSVLHAKSALITKLALVCGSIIIKCLGGFSHLRVFIKVTERSNGI